MDPRRPPKYGQQGETRISVLEPGGGRGGAWPGPPMLTRPASPRLLAHGPSNRAGGPDPAPPRGSHFPPDPRKPNATQGGQSSPGPPPRPDAGHGRGLVGGAAGRPPESWYPSGGSVRPRWPSLTSGAPAQAGYGRRAPGASRLRSPAQSSRPLRPCADRWPSRGGR